MAEQVPSITVLLLSAGLALQLGNGWLDRVVQYQKNKLFNEVRELAPININAELLPKPEGYEDSKHWDYESVIRLLTLIRESETAKPVHRALRRMMQPTRRLVMSMKQSMHRFPSLNKDGNNFYYDVDYSSAEEQAPPAVPLPEDQAVIVVSNPVEARLPSARISVKLLREILEARARAARQMPTTTQIIPWKEFIKNRTFTSTKATKSTGSTKDDQGNETNITSSPNDTDFNSLIYSTTINGSAATVNATSSPAVTSPENEPASALNSTSGNSTSS